MHHLFLLIRSLERGGAQRQLTELVQELHTRFRITVTTFYDGGSLRSELENLSGVCVLSLGKKSRWDLISPLWRLWRILQQIKPDILHSYMGIANEVGLLLGRFVGTKVVWGLRASDMNLSSYGWAEVLSFKLSAWLSRFTDLIIVNSHAGRNHYLKHGYCPHVMMVIPNGIDIYKFRPNCKAGLQLRTLWDIMPESILIGLVGRLDPVKDHPTFLKAAALLAQDHEEIRFVCVGEGPQSYTNELITIGKKLGLESKLIWAGAHDNMAAVYNALDIVALTSHSEGFPNVIGEAMACGKTCVVTDVGDLALIVGETGIVVPPQDVKALANGISKLLSLSITEREKMGNSARTRVNSLFACEYLACKTTDTLLRLL